MIKILGESFLKSKVNWNNETACFIVPNIYSIKTYWMDIAHEIMVNSCNKHAQIKTNHI